MEANKHSPLTKSFWIINILFWLSVHSLFAHIRYTSLLQSNAPISWLENWLILSPWVLSWIWICAVVNILTTKLYLNSLSKLQHVLRHLLGALICLPLYWLSCLTIRMLMKGESTTYVINGLLNVPYTTLHLDISIYLGILATSYASHLYHISVSEKLELRKLQNELLNEQLKTLRAQLNPHFLFNVLNTVVSLVRLERNKEAVSALTDLSQMLRTILENKTEDLVLIKDELAFVNSYLAIQKVRFEEKLSTRIQVDYDCLEVRIPNMLLHPLVENAVQHGSQLEAKTNTVDMHIFKQDNELNVVITNNAGTTDENSGFGIGLANTKARVNKFFSHCKFESKLLSSGLFETKLALPIKE